MKVCLTNPFWHTEQHSGIRSGSRVPNMIGGSEHTFIPFPFPLAYAASYLESHGIEVLLIDGIAEGIGEEDYYQRVIAFEPDLIVNEMSTASYRYDGEVIRRLKQVTRAHIAVCGPHPTALPQETLTDNPDITAVFVGEMEETLLEFARGISSPSAWHTIDGLAFRDDAGAVMVNKRRALIADIDALPYPKRTGVPLDRYCVAGFASPTLFMYGSRGCPYVCNFCLWPQTMYGARQYRARSPQAIVAEIASVWKEYGPFGSIYFDDDTFNIGKERMREFASAMRSLPFTVPWGCNARPDLFDRETMRILADAGLFCVRIGIESGDEEVLRRAKKELDLQAVRRCIDDAHALGISVHVSYTIGLSGESWDSVERTIAFATSIVPDSVAFTITTPYPGTGYHEEALNKGYLQTRDWERYNGIMDGVVRTDHMTAEEVVKAERYVMRKVYYSPAYVLRRFRYASNLREIMTLIRKGIRLFSYR